MRLLHFFQTEWREDDTPPEYVSMWFTFALACVCTLLELPMTSISTFIETDMARRYGIHNNVCYVSSGNGFVAKWKRQPNVISSFRVMWQIFATDITQYSNYFNKYFVYLIRTQCFDTFLLILNSFSKFIVKAIEYGIDNDAASHRRNVASICQWN